MQKLKIPVGISDFAEIRENGYYYIDKSGLIKEILNEEATKVTLITRPRRFGKTLAMSMLANFFDITKKSEQLFSNLQIEGYPELCSGWMNKYPVLFLSFKDVDGNTFENAFGLLKFTLSQFCDAHAYLENNEKVTDLQRAVFERLRNQRAELVDVQSSLLILLKMMQTYYEKPVILLLDEYDVPLAKASNKGYYEEMMEVVKIMLSTALKDNSSLKFAVVTGCLKIAKESIFTGTNNFVSDTITSTRYEEFFGFTQKDVDQILQDADAVAYSACIKRWYDGYRFGNFDVYCPWDVMNYIRDIQHDSDAKPKGYWKNTSDNAIIRSFIDFAGDTITSKLETLLSGGYIVEQIEENLTYDYLHSSEENLWSILFLTGYLTKVCDRDVQQPFPEELTALRIPNEEIRDIFETTVKKWFNDNAKTWNRKMLFEAVWNGDSDAITKEMSQLLRMTISYHDYREDFYHAFLAGIFTGAGYVVQSNKEYGEGRSDVVVFDSRRGRVAVFEAKYVKELKRLEQGCDEAIRQIDERQYAAEFEDNYDEVFCYEISFYKKRCMVKRK